MLDLEYPTLDAHAHLDHRRSLKDLESSGSVLAMSLSLQEATHVMDRREGNIAWGVGCHPRFPKAQETFSQDTFRHLLDPTAIVGEIGLDYGARVPIELQIKNFIQILEVVGDLPRLVSIHSYRASGFVLRELKLRPIQVPVLHWWTGSASETSEAVEMGCYFSIHSAVARQSKFRTRVPPERVMVESDHGYNDPPAGIPFRIGWVEQLIAQQYGMEPGEVRKLVWKNFARIIKQTGTKDLLPGVLSANLSEFL